MASVVERVKPATTNTIEARSDLVDERNRESVLGGIDMRYPSPLTRTAHAF